MSSTVERYIWKLKNGNHYIMTDSLSTSGVVTVNNVNKDAMGFYAYDGHQYDVEAVPVTKNNADYNKSGGYEKGNYVKFTLTTSGAEYQTDSSYCQPCKLSIEYGPRFNNGERSELVLEGHIICGNNGLQRYQYAEAGQFFSHDFSYSIEGDLNSSGEMYFTSYGDYSGFFNDRNYSIEFGNSARYYPYVFEKVDGKWQISFVGIPM